MNLHGLIQFPKTANFTPDICFQFFKCVEVCDFYLWGHLKIKVYATNPHILEELKASIRSEIDYFENWINPCKCTFHKNVPEMCGWRRTTFPTSLVIRYVIIFAHNFTQFRPPCCGQHLSKRHCISQYSWLLFQNSLKASNSGGSSSYHTHIISEDQSHYIINCIINNNFTGYQPVQV